MNASATSKLSPTFTTTTPTQCTAGGANGTTITLHATGTCTVQANQGGNDDHDAAAPLARSFTVR